MTNNKYNISLCDVWFGSDKVSVMYECVLYGCFQIPFGIAQIGKAFRNEITPRNFIFRSREFEQMEIEYFITPDDEAWQKVVV